MGDAHLGGIAERLSGRHRLRQDRIDGMIYFTELHFPTLTIAYNETGRESSASDSGLSGLQ